MIFDLKKYFCALTNIVQYKSETQKKLFMSLWLAVASNNLSYAIFDYCVLQHCPAVLKQRLAIVHDAYHYRNG